MPVTDLLRRNAREHGDEVALIELNPAMEETRKISFKEFDLVQQTKSTPYRHEITWQIFDEKSNRVANMLLGRGIKKGDKVAILMFNCLEWLPIYFGILKTGAIAVPFNFRYTANEISYCADLAEISVMFFGPEFVDRLNINAEELAKDRLLLYVGDGQAPEFAENYWQQVADYSSRDPMIELTEEDYAAIYFSSGTTGFPKAILHPHRSLTQAAEMEAVHHETGKNDCFLCIPPLYHTGAKFHWMGSLWTCSRAVLLKGTKPEVILKAASDEQCTIVWLLVPWAQDILDALDRGELKLSDYNDFLKEHPTRRVDFIRSKDRTHDRYIVIDNDTVGMKIYHCGASSKDAGKRITTITRLSDVNEHKEMIASLLSNKKLILS